MWIRLEEPPEVLGAWIEDEQLDLRVVRISNHDGVAEVCLDDSNMRRTYGVKVSYPYVELGTVGHAKGQMIKVYPSSSKRSGASRHATTVTANPEG